MKQLNSTYILVPQKSMYYFKISHRVQLTVTQFLAMVLKAAACESRNLSEMSVKTMRRQSHYNRTRTAYESPWVCVNVSWLTSSAEGTRFPKNYEGLLPSLDLGRKQARSWVYKHIRFWDESSQKPATLDRVLSLEKFQSTSLPKRGISSTDGN